jgi:hypothetical protein
MKFYLATLAGAALIIASAVMPAHAQQEAQITQQEISAFRKQYDAWARDRGLNVWTWANVVGSDLDRSAALVKYNAECEPIEPTVLRRARIMLQAFPKGIVTGPFSQDKMEHLFKIQGRDKFCRSVNPTPRP